MKKLALTAVAICMVPLPTQAVANEQDNKARRLVSAVQGNMDYVDRDFLVPLTETSKKALSEFGDCKTRFIRVETAGGVIIEPLPQTPTKDEIIVGLVCPGYQRSAGAGLTVRFENGKISSVETHAPKSPRDKNG